MSPETEKIINPHIKNILAMRSESGLFTASAQDVSTGYNKAWIRDNFYTALCFEYIEDWETVRDTWRAILDLFIKHKDKINWAGENKPFHTWQYIHARYNPKTFEEFWEEWGNKQNDAVGGVLFKLADLEEKGRGIIKDDEDKKIINSLIKYLASIEYWHDPDNGVWEEYEEVHASSVGACVAGLKKASKLSFTKIPEGLIKKGEESLKHLLPRESKSKFTDLALLSLIYPYGVVDEEMTDEILRHLEYFLERNRGIVRYKNDHYYNKNKDDVSEEAEWTFGFSWLSIIYSKMGDTKKAKKYFKKAQATITADNKIPELYYSDSDKPNENTPLAWAESLFVISAVELDRLSSIKT